MNAMGKVTLRGISHGAIVGVTGDRIRAATMRRALQNQPVGSKHSEAIRQAKSAKSSK